MPTVFREQEDAVGYMRLLEQLVRRHGRPLALYHDHHDIFQVNQASAEAQSLHVDPLSAREQEAWSCWRRVPQIRRLQMP